MVAPTEAQRRLLEAVRDGRRLHSYPGGTITSEPHMVFTAGTVSACARAGLLRHRGNIADLVITPTGLAALEEKENG